MRGLSGLPTAGTEPVTFGKLEIEWVPSFPDHARIDVGCLAGPPLRPEGGLIELRVLPRRGIKLTVYTELAYDIGRAFMRSRWRRANREFRESYPTGCVHGQCPKPDGCWMHCEDRTPVR